MNTTKTLTALSAALALHTTTALAVSVATGGVLLSWPASAEGFGLVSRSDLATGTWETVTNAPSLNGTRKEVLLPTATPAQRFFRLSKPGP